MGRNVEIERETKETQIAVRLEIDGNGDSDIDTGVGFFDHMLTHIAKHGMLTLTVKATGDTHIDDHHTVEDVGIVLGQAFARAIGDKAGMVRFGSAMCPLDEALVTVALDFSGRAHLEYGLGLPTERVGTFDTELAHEFFRAFVSNSMISLHLVQQSGENSHHILESAFKSFGRALDAATQIDPRLSGVPSTKGTL